MQLAFGSAVVLLLLCGLATYDAVVRLRAAEAWVGHTRDVQSTLADLNNISSRAGRARTRYIDTGEDTFLQDYQAAAGEVPEKIKRLNQMTSDNADRQEDWRRLDKITSTRFNLLNRSVQLKQSGASDPPEQARLRQQIIDISGQEDALLQKMQDDEQRLLDRRRLHSERLFTITSYILCAAFLVVLALFLFHYRLLNTELKAREQAEGSLRGLSVRLLELQDQERRKFSRELHDSLGQYLVGVKMNLTMLGNSTPGNSYISESMKLLDSAMTETRTISHLLHPPLLDETGLASAARWYVEGFAKRSGIPTSLDIPEDFERLPSSLELALFRVLQESLTNVHRHSKSPRADVSLCLFQDEVVLRVRDYGKGMPREVLERFQQNRTHGGVGLAGMRERIHELGGHLEMDSDGHGTQVLAKMPRSEKRAVLDMTAD
ncbi:MAG TPA: CHASE3 domain-containing protein [Terriglobales bacterium]|nr:CHASE3 domain-containing protein [Terriglobales bacterium]